MSVFSLKVWFKTEFLGNHCGVLEVLQLDVLDLAGENCCCFSIALFLFEECMDYSDNIWYTWSYWLVLIALSTTGILVITIRHSDFFSIVQFQLILLLSEWLQTLAISKCGKSQMKCHFIYKNKQMLVLFIWVYSCTCGIYMHVVFF